MPASHFQPKSSTTSSHDATALHRLTGIIRELHPKSGPTWSRARVELDTGDLAWIVAKFQMEQGEIITADCTFNSKFRSYDIVELIAPEEGKVANAVVVLKLAEYLDGVGKVKAGKLSEQFPGVLFQKLLDEPDEIAKACGAEVRDVVMVAEQLRLEQTALGRMSDLMGKGFPNHLAKRICRSDSLYCVAAKSPYKAIPLVEGLGWLIADEIGRKQGIKVDDPERVEAGIEHYYATKVAGDGHTRVTEREMLAPEALPSLLGLRAAVLKDSLPQVLIPVGDGWLVSGRHRENAAVIEEFFLGGT